MKNEEFYQSLLDFVDDPQEEDEVKELLDWWNKYAFLASNDAHTNDRYDSLIFPSQAFVGRKQVPSTSALAALRARRRKILQEKLQQTK